jgi:hypothetical protein
MLFQSQILKKRQNGERSLEHEVEKLQNLNKNS